MRAASQGAVKITKVHYMHVKLSIKKNLPKVCIYTEDIVYMLIYAMLLFINISNN